MTSNAADGGCFELHPRLKSDTIPVADWPLCRVLLMNDCRFPWLILVPRRAGASEIHDLPAADRGRLAEETAEVSRALAEAFRPDKVNVGALGNLVAQLHVHVIARWRSDPAWPGPVWGNGEPTPYAPGAAETVIERLCAAWNAPV